MHQADGFVRRVTVAAALALVATLFLWGCASPGRQPERTQIQPDEFDPYDPSLMPPEVYLIRPGDGITVTFLYNPEFNVVETIVRDDGMITLPVIGDVPAAQHSTKQVETVIREAYKEYVAKTGHGRQLRAGDEIQIRFVYNPHLNQRVVVRPDGKVSMLKLGEMEVEGMEFTKFESTVREAYARYIRDPEMAVYLLHSPTKKIYVDEGDVTVMVTNPQPKEVFVGGEVGAPTMIQFRDWLTPWQAISRAGGLRNGGDAGRVIYITRGADGTALTTKIDLQAYLRNNSKSQNLFLRHGDVLIVPRTGITKLGLFVQQYIRDVMPFVTNISFSYIINEDVYVR